MAAKVDALVRNFLRTDGDALCLALGERMYLLKGGARSVVGREPLSEESFRAIADELSPGDLMESLVETEFQTTFRVDEATEPVAIRFGRVDGTPGMSLSRDRPAAARAAAPAATTPASTQKSAGAQGSSEASGARSAATNPLTPGPAAKAKAAEALPVSTANAASVSTASAATASAATASAATTHAATTHAAAGSSGSSGAARGAISNSRSEKPIDRMLLRMLAASASDIHLSSASVPCFRIHGDITPQEEMGLQSSEQIEALLGPILPPKNRAEFAERNDTDFAYEIEGVSRFRVNVFRDRKGVGAVLRQIPVDILSAEQLNLPPAVIQLAELHKGLVLVTGPTGSGKSTTLAAIVDHVNNTRSDHIITIEDPIEFVHPNKKCLVNQREVGGHTRGFKDALRAALREDPDIVLVGEMRDLETVAIAIETAETGHLVFGTLHTTTAPSTVDRVIDQFPEDRQAQIRVMLAESLKAVVAQTLLKKKGGGRVAALEILLVNNAVSNLIRDGKTFQIPSIMQTSRGIGMQMLNDSLLELVRKGIVEPREAYMKSVDRPGLLAAMKSLNVPGIAELTRETSAPTPALASATGGR